MTGKRGTLEERFWRHVVRGATSEDCWSWDKAETGNGYGLLSAPGASGTPLLAHRVSWEIHFGSVPSGQEVLHRCDNRSCCRPECLFLGTQAENLADMRDKGRDSPPPLKAGEDHGQALLTNAQAAEIRARYTGSYGERIVLAREYGVGVHVIKGVVSAARPTYRETNP